MPLPRPTHRTCLVPSWERAPARIRRGTRGTPSTLICAQADENRRMTVVVRRRVEDSRLRCDERVSFSSTSLHHSTTASSSGRMRANSRSRTRKPGCRPTVSRSRPATRAPSGARLLRSPRTQPMATQRLVLPIPGGETGRVDEGLERQSVLPRSESRPEHRRAGVDPVRREGRRSSPSSRRTPSARRRRRRAGSPTATPATTRTTTVRMLVASRRACGKRLGSRSRGM